MEKPETARFQNAIRRACSGKGRTLLELVSVEMAKNTIVHRIVRTTTWDSEDDLSTLGWVQPNEILVHDIDDADWVILVSWCEDTENPKWHDWKKMAHYIVQKLEILRLRKNAEAARYVLWQVHENVRRYAHRWGDFRELTVYHRCYHEEVAYFHKDWQRFVREAHLPQMYRNIRPRAVVSARDPMGNSCNICRAEFMGGEHVQEGFCESPVGLPCGCAGAFGRSCVTAWLLSEWTCPFCRFNFDELVDVDALRPPEIVHAFGAIH